MSPDGHDSVRLRGSTELGPDCPGCLGPTRTLNPTEGIDRDAALVINFCPACNTDWTYVDSKVFGRVIPILIDFVDISK